MAITIQVQILTFAATNILRAVIFLLESVYLLAVSALTQSATAQDKPHTCSLWVIGFICASWSSLLKVFCADKIILLLW